MMNERFKRAARRRRAAALVLTLLFHVLLIAGMVYASNNEMSDLLPDGVREWLGLNTSQPDQPAEETTSLPQP